MSGLRVTLIDVPRDRARRAFEGPRSGCYMPDSFAIVSGAVQLAHASGDDTWTAPPAKRHVGLKVGARPPEPLTFRPTSQATAAPDDPDRPACAGFDPGMFTARHAAFAKRVCAGCPLARKRACLEEAFEQGDHHTVRGGLTPRERQALERAS